ncbi:MAG: hypothetical protein R6V03_11305 [Kiritimatiellia bacterium]
MKSKLFMRLGLSVFLAAGSVAVGEEKRDAESAIRAGLKWLADNQVTRGTEAGSWPCERPQYRPAVASLAGLAFLANGYFPRDGRYGEVLDRSMEYVRASMTPDGYLGQGDRSGMYIHAICSLFGFSYLGTSGDPETERGLADWCRESLRVIADAHAVRRPSVARGGWRYTPYTSESDVSVTSWQLLVLHSARQCGYSVDAGMLHSGLAYVNSAFRDPKEDERKANSGFLYRPGVSREPEPAVSGVAVFIKSLLEGEQDDKTRKTLDYLKRFPPSWGGEQYSGYFYFTLFYMSQGMFQVGGETWSEFADASHQILIEHQGGDGKWPFPPDNTPQSRLTGEAYPTAMAVLVLSLEKQYLPMYQRQKSLY